jgi:aspartyl-tRNA(Asn)/glutamyl-tRNA(Gln) amidotransferase subunit A
LIQQDFDQVFQQKNPLNNSKTGDAHVLLVPSATSPAPRLDKANEASGVEEYIDDVMTLPANLAGIPAITIPSKQYKGNDEYPIGLQLMGQYGSDRLVMKIADIMTKDF